MRCPYLFRFISQIVPVFEENEEEESMFELLSPPGAVSIGGLGTEDNEPFIRSVHESELEMVADFKIAADTSGGLPIDARVYEYFATFDRDRSRFVPFADVFIQNGFALRDERKATVLGKRQIRVQYRIGLDAAARLGGKTSEILCSDLAKEDAEMEIVLLNLFVIIHSALCNVKFDLENIEPLRNPLFKNGIL